MSHVVITTASKLVNPGRLMHRTHCTFVWRSERVSEGTPTSREYRIVVSECGAGRKDRRVADGMPGGHSAVTPRGYTGTRRVLPALRPMTRTEVTPYALISINPRALTTFAMGSAI